MKKNKTMKVSSREVNIYIFNRVKIKKKEDFCMCVRLVIIVISDWLS